MADLSHHALNERLKKAFPCSDADLKANRAGQMSEAQKERLLSQRVDVGWSWLVSIGASALFGCYLLFNATTDSAKSSNKGFGLLIICGAGVAVLVMLAVLTMMTDDARKDTVMAEQGPLKRRVRTSRRDTFYSVCVGKIWFGVSDYVYESFIEGEPYILYYGPDSQRLIAAEHQREPITTPDPPPVDPSNPLVSS